MTDFLTDRVTPPAPGTVNGRATGHDTTAHTGRHRAAARTVRDSSTTTRATGDGAPARTARRSFDLDPARRLRTLTGVDEELLARVRYERSKYTALGGVVLGTSVIAAFSMWNFAGEVLGRVSVVALVPTVIWMLFVLNLDRWLVTPQPNARRRVGPLLTRLLIALMLGTVIAEPLVLRIFQTAIEERVAGERTDDIDQLRTDLVRCNPMPSTTRTAAPEGCGRTYVLSFGKSPGEQAEELVAVRADATELRKRVDRDTTRLEALDSEVRDECRRMIRMAATGLLQRTSECLRLREKAQEYRAIHDTDENEKRLARMDSRISKIEAEQTVSRGDFLRTRADGIEQRLDEERVKHQEIGVLERMLALDRLATGNPVLFVGIWLVRLLFVLLDILPVLVKYLSGESAYDRMLTSASNSAVKIHDEEIRITERRVLAELELAQDAVDQDVRRHRAESEAELREHKAEMNIRVRQAVNALEDEIRRTSTV
ncbi:DUF4407 domain-containing protein [Streptomyces sp. NBC_01498]|uniref:DUF4407 domain-containing protein n=1 Tax=Streptomyces sp. NBC_01498 TaxID=2975870 RepID=UPI002E7AC742|nr:DUF4407 domain-containing protein [Streptomyces sp. NBC_01498]WTL25622.1 DUF4407 domain-containing protein [Streptomyces sp. NBC_01498]